MQDDYIVVIERWLLHNAWRLVLLGVLLLLAFTGIPIYQINESAYANEPSVINYPLEADTPQEKLLCVYSLLEQMRLEHNRIGAIARSNWEKYELKWREYQKIFEAKQQPLLREQSRLRDIIRNSTYSEKEWHALDDAGKHSAYLSMHGNKSILKESPTLATSDLLNQLKDVDFYSLKGHFVDPAEDFTTYTEVDTNGRFSVNSSNITVTGLTRNENAYVYKDGGANYITGDFEFLVTVVNYGGGGDGGTIGYAFLANYIGDMVDGNGVGGILYQYGSSEWIGIEEFYNGGGDFQYDYYVCVEDQIYYTKLSRATNDYYQYIYDDAARTNLVDTLTFALQNTDSYQYVYGAISRNTGDALKIANGEISDLDLQLGGGVVAPTIVTNDPPLAIWTTSANLSGNVTATGGEDVSWHGFYYDTDGSPYANSQGTTSNISTGMFTENVTGLSAGTAYHYMASGNNTSGSGNGSDVTFITLPEGPIAITVNHTASTSISFDWTAIASADNYTIRYQAGAVPVTSNTTGTSGYYGTSNAANVTGLTASTQYTFSLFTLADDEGLQSCSANFAYVTQTTTSGVVAPTVVTNAPNSIWTTSANLSGNVTATGGEDVNWHGFYYDTDGTPYANNQGTSSNISTGEFTENITGLQAGTTYHIIASGNNTAGYGNGTEVTFITLPVGPGAITVNQTGYTWIEFTWGAIASADNYTIRYQAGVAPVTDNTSGTSGYYGTAISANVTGLTQGTQYTFSLFTLADDEALQSCSANFSYVTANTSGYSAPTVVTNTPNAIWTTSANVSGNVTATGGQDVNWHGFYYDTDGSPYANSKGTSSNISTPQEFTENITSLSAGTTYHIIASANNSSAGSGNGTEVTFITLPVGPTDLTTNITSYYSVSFDWTAIASADNYTIRWQVGAAPVTSNTTGTSGYYGTANAANVTGLTPGTQYTFSLFTLADDEGLQSCSANFAYATVTTASLPISAPTVVTNDPPLAIWTTSANVSGNVTATGGEDVNWHGFYYDTDGSPYANSKGTSSNMSTGMFTENLTSLNAGTAYHYMASGNNTSGSGNGTDVTFITLPVGPNPISVNRTGDTWIEFTWTAVASADNYTIRYQAGAAAVTDNASGTSGYYGTSTVANVTGLAPNTQYTFSLFTLADDEGLQSCSANYSYITANTSVGVPAVTTNAATNIGNDSAKLNGTITDDGGAASLNVTWYWDTVDHGATDNWTNSANQTGQVLGAVTYTIPAGNLTAGTLYYTIVKVINTGGSAFGATVNFTTTNITAVFPPTNITLTDMGGSTVRLTWTTGVNAVYSEFRISRTGYPTTNTSGEALYYGNATMYDITGWDIDVSTIYISGWGVAADNATISATYNTATIGGTMGILITMGFIPLFLTFAMFLTRNRLLGFPAAMFWAVFGGYLYTQSTTAWGDWQYFGMFASMGMVIFCMYAQYALKEQVDVGATDEEEYIDEEGGDGNKGYYFDETEPEQSMRSKNLQKRAANRRKGIFKKRPFIFR